MRGTSPHSTTLAEWASIPRRLRRAVSGLSARDLKARGGSEGWSIQQYAHHLVEANLIASNIVLAALGKPGCRFDWSWLMPDKRWIKRLGYDQVPLEPAIKLLESLCSHVAGVADRTRGSMTRQVRLVGSPGRRPNRRTLRQIFKDECEHAEHHLRDIASTKSASFHTRRKRRPR
jgi:hypothetical protein